MIDSVGFFAVGLATLVSAFFVVEGRNLIRAVLWLAVSLLGTAVLYAMMGAPFLAGVQVLTYIGGVVTLLIFGVMVTKRHEGSAIVADHAEKGRARIVSGGLFVLLAMATFKTDLSAAVAAPSVSTADLGRALLSHDLVAFEGASLLLLAAIIGAVVIARRRDVEVQSGAPEVES